jgi:hypothetical protein
MIKHSERQCGVLEWVGFATKCPSFVSFIMPLYFVYGLNLDVMVIMSVSICYGVWSWILYYVQKLVLSIIKFN